MAARANLTITQGATFSTDVTVTDNDGSVFDLTGHTSYAALAKGFASGHVSRNSVKYLNHRSLLSLKGPLVNQRLLFL